MWVFCPAPAGCTHIDNRVVPRGTCALLLQQPTNLHLEATPEAPPEALLFTAWGTNVSFVSGYIGGQPNAGPGEPASRALGAGCCQPPVGAGSTGAAAEWQQHAGICTVTPGLSLLSAHACSPLPPLPPTGRPC